MEMVKQQAKKAADHILEDRQGADYYRDPTILAGYLEGALGIDKETAWQTATDINHDRDGANYYAKAEILADFLVGR